MRALSTPALAASPAPGEHTGHDYDCEELLHRHLPREALHITASMDGPTAPGSENAPALRDGLRRCAWQVQHTRARLPCGALYQGSISPSRRTGSPGRRDRGGLYRDRWDKSVARVRTSTGTGSRPDVWRTAASRRTPGGGAGSCGVVPGPVRVPGPGRVLAFTNAVEGVKLFRCPGGCSQVIDVES